VDAGIAKASAATVTVCLIEPPSVSGESLSSVIVESDESYQMILLLLVS
jgi:hypothetical protein